MKQNPHPLTAWRHAYGLSQEELAKLVGVQSPAISKWESRKTPKLVPAEQVPRLSQITGIPHHKLRPDLYPAPAKDGAAA